MGRASPKTSAGERDLPLPWGQRQYVHVCVHGEVGRVSRTARSQARVRPPLSTETASGEGDRPLYLSNLSRVEGKSSTLALPCWGLQLVPSIWLAVLGADKLLGAFLTTAMVHSLRKELVPCLPPPPPALAALLESQEDGFPLLTIAYG